MDSTQLNEIGGGYPSQIGYPESSYVGYVDISPSQDNIRANQLISLSPMSTFQNLNTLEPQFSYEPQFPYESQFPYEEELISNSSMDATNLAESPDVNKSTISCNDQPATLEKVMSTIAILLFRLVKPEVVKPECGKCNSIFATNSNRNRHGRKCTATATNRLKQKQVSTPILQIASCLVVSIHNKASKLN